MHAPPEERDSFYLPQRGGPLPQVPEGAAPAKTGAQMLLENAYRVSDGSSQDAPEPLSLENAYRKSEEAILDDAPDTIAALRFREHTLMVLPKSVSRGSRSRTSPFASDSGAGSTRRSRDAPKEDDLADVFAGKSKSEPVEDLFGGTTPDDVGGGNPFSVGPKEKDNASTPATGSGSE